MPLYNGHNVNPTECFALIFTTLPASHREAQQRGKHTDPLISLSSACRGWRVWTARAETHEEEGDGRGIGHTGIGIGSCFDARCGADIAYGASSGGAGELMPSTPEAVSTLPTCYAMSSTDVAMSSTK
eukprot:3433662-Rhodomonas_salina.1